MFSYFAFAGVHYNSGVLFANAADGVMDKWNYGTSSSSGYTCHSKYGDIIGVCNRDLRFHHRTCCDYDMCSEYKAS